MRRQTWSFRDIGDHTGQTGPLPCPGREVERRALNHGAQAWDALGTQSGPAPGGLKCQLSVLTGPSVKNSTGTEGSLCSRDPGWETHSWPGLGSPGGSLVPSPGARLGRVSGRPGGQTTATRPATPRGLAPRTVQSRWFGGGSASSAGAPADPVVAAAPFVTQPGKSRVVPLAVLYWSKQWHTGPDPTRNGTDDQETWSYFRATLAAHL